MKKRLYIGLFPLVVGLFWASTRMLNHLREPMAQEVASLIRFRVRSLPFFAMGHPGLLSDFLMARGLSFFGSNRQSKDAHTFSGLAQLFEQAFNLDPYNRELLLFGANILAGIDLQSAQSLLNTGMRRYPADWKFPELAGFLQYYFARDPLSAARLYERASSLPGHPPFVPSISSKLYEESGFFQQAIGVLRNLAGDSADRKVRRGFEERVAQLEERLRLRRFRVPVRLKEVVSATRLRLDLDRFNPYPELESTLELDFTGFTMNPNECEQAIMVSVWRKWRGREVWMQLQTVETGQLVRSGDALCGVLQGDGGENLADVLLKSIRNRPILAGGSPWEESIGQVVTICGFLQEVRLDEGNLELFWREEGLPRVFIADIDLPDFGVVDWQSWLKEHRNERQSVSGLLTADDGRNPALLLLRPAQISACASVR